jgi:hypothetical protein
MVVLRVQLEVELLQVPPAAVHTKEAFGVGVEKTVWHFCVVGFHAPPIAAQELLTAAVLIPAGELVGRRVSQ